jgi:predicted glycosyltransferase
MSFAEVLRLRRDMLLALFRRFAPDVLLVDYMPAGLKGELAPALRHLRQFAPHTRLVLGLRDVLDEAPRVRQGWAADGAYELVDDLYDRILVFGQRDVYDFAAEAGLSPRAAAKVRYAGSLRRNAGAQSSAELRERLRLTTGRLVLVTVGGGSDGFPLLAAMAQALRERPPDPPFDCLLVGGPLLPAEDRDRLHALLPDTGPVHFAAVIDDLAPYVAAADVVVSRAGYNTVCEILSFNRPAVLVPRTTIRQVGDNQEQLIRARALAERGLARMITPAELSPARLLAEINGLLATPLQPRATLNLNGLPAVAEEMATLLGWPIS